MSLLTVSELCVSFPTSNGIVEAVRGVSFDLASGSVLAMAGESGSGKSVCAEAIMGLLPASAVVSGEILYKGVNLRSVSEREMVRIRGAEIAMVFQEPTASLDPVITIGRQLKEAFVAHQRKMTTQAWNERASSLLSAVGIADSGRILRSFPHELSGGMQQRVMVAMAILNSPAIVIADEATTALDVTVQAQILRLLARIKEDERTSIIIITHDLGVVAGLADHILVMYGGAIVEAGPTEQVFQSPQHPYTIGLISSMPDVRGDQLERLATIPGTPPDPTNLPGGCAFEPRCSYARPICTEISPELRPMDVSGTHASRCHFSGQLSVDLSDPVRRMNTSD